MDIRQSASGLYICTRVSFEVLTVMPLLPFVEDCGISKDEALGRVVERKDN